MWSVAFYRHKSPAFPQKTNASYIDVAECATITLFVQRLAFAGLRRKEALTHKPTDLWIMLAVAHWKEDSSPILLRGQWAH